METRGFSPALDTVLSRKRKLAGKVVVRSQPQPLNPQRAYDTYGAGWKPRPFKAGTNPEFLDSRAMGNTFTYANSCLLQSPIGELPSGMHAHGVTRKTTLLTKIPAGVVTLTAPGNAPGGTDVSISPGATTVKVACTPPLKVTSVAPDKLVPKILTIVPTGPDAGDIVMKGGSRK